MTKLCRKVIRTWILGRQKELREEGEIENQGKELEIIHTSKGKEVGK